MRSPCPWPVGRVSRGAGGFVRGQFLDEIGECDHRTGPALAPGRRRRFGEALSCEPSRFLAELPRDLLEWDGADPERDAARSRKTATASLKHLKELFG